MHNRQWAYEVKKNLKVKSDVLVYEWEHWKNNGSMKVSFEVEKLIFLIGNEKVNIIAKSVGTRITMLLADKKSDIFQKVILCGIPVDPVGYAKGLKKIGSEKLLVIQNSKDPFMSYGKIRLYLKLIDKRIKVIKKEASNHDYPYYSDFNKFLN